jgi:hypothetical protein
VPKRDVGMLSPPSLVHVVPPEDDCTPQATLSLRGSSGFSEPILPFLHGGGIGWLSKHRRQAKSPTVAPRDPDPTV